MESILIAISTLILAVQDRQLWLVLILFTDQIFSPKPNRVVLEMSWPPIDLE